MSSKLAQFFAKNRLSKSSLTLDIQDVRSTIDTLIGLIFPQRGHLENLTEEHIESTTLKVKSKLTDYLKILAPLSSDSHFLPEEKIHKFFEQIPQICHDLDLDALAAFEGDPAAYSVEEVILSYPGFFAICTYRLAHALHELNIPLLPRLLGEYAHEKTGIDIHPGAKIGKHFFIDHGTGVVIGETSVIGNRVKIYQGVTLGALSVKKTLQSKKRHPTIEDEVVIYANATILGGETIVGKNSIIGGNTWITESVPEGTTLTLTTK
jgi:serine O-acetyltransferase